MIHSNPSLIQVYIDKSLKEDFRVSCFQNHTTMSHQLRDSVKRFVKANPPKNQRDHENQLGLSLD